MAYCYILHSAKLNKFYIGATRNSIKERVQKHLTQFYGTNHFTAKAGDWKLFLEIEAKDFTHALKIENTIKAKKSAVFIKNLTKYPELLTKTINQTK